MTATRELLPAAFYTTCKPDDLPFETTAELNAGIEIPGQARAAEALQFGLGIKREGYNVFALGAAGTGKQFLVENFLRERASKRPIAPDLCYVTILRNRTSLLFSFSPWTWLRPEEGPEGIH